MLQAVEATVPDTSIRKPMILAVDDTPGNLVALEAVLERDFEIVAVSSGAKAIEVLEHRSDIALVLMDVQMPVMDGFEAAERIKKLPGCHDLPIVFITAVYNEDPYIKRGYKSGGIDYFTKPFDPELLRLKVGIYASFRQRAALLNEREERVRQTEELLAAGRKLSAVLESLPVGVLVADTDGRICQANDQASRIFNATEVLAHDEYGKSLGWWESDGRTIKDPNGPLARALHGESSHNEQLRVLCVDGASKRLVASASPLFGVGGDVVGAVIVFRDTSESKQIEQELEARVARLVSLGLELGQSARPVPRAP